MRPVHKTFAARIIALALLTAVFALPSGLRAQTQNEMSADACADSATADAQLKATYGQVLSQHSDDALFVTRFKAAQQAWVSFRDAEIRAIYPSQDALNGTTLPMCSCAERTKLTQERVKQLQTWLKKNEGDVCAGSR